MSAPFQPVQPPPMRPIIKEFTALPTGAMVGIADVQLPSGMVLHRCAIFNKDGKQWAMPPGRPMLDRDGRVLKNESGKAKYEPTVSFADRTTQDRWSAAVIDALRADRPEVLP